MRGALHAPAQAHLGRAVVVEDAAVASACSTALTIAWGTWSVLSSTLLQAQLPALRHAAPRQGEDLHGDAHHDARPLGFENVERGADVGDRPVRQRRRPEPLEAASQKLTDAARPLAGKQDEHPVVGSGQHRHAVMEEVDRELLIGGAEVDALGLAGRARGRQRHDPRDLATTHAEKTHALSPDVVGGREGQPRDVVESGDVSGPHGGQPAGVEAAALAGAGDRLAQGTELVPAQSLHVGRAGTTQDPRFQRRAFGRCAFRRRAFERRAFRPCPRRVADARHDAPSPGRDPLRCERRPTPSPCPSAAVRL